MKALQARLFADRHEHLGQCVLEIAIKAMAA